MGPEPFPVVPLSLLRKEKLVVIALDKRMMGLVLTCGAVVVTATLALTPVAGAQPVAPAAPNGVTLTHPLTDNSALRLPAAANAARDARAARSLDYSQQVQQNDEWCWAADGASIEQFHGASTSQDQFCAAGKGTTAGNCPNQAAQIGEIVNGFRGTGFSASSAGGAVSFSTITQQIDAGNPALTGIYWTSGGGHAEVIYGYDAGNQSMDVGDPWPTYQRYRTQSYNDYLRNSEFTWGDTVVGITGGR
ncbi:papain-like cysteine protease family protein [Amycolatopsis sp. NBC_00438]|uniref:papain-like cysteine protease family protein n=1 Tax=Amycolatopsis sp. NBC_00438 TaxID=2903558 RepID=UPI002E1D1989